VEVPFPVAFAEARVNVSLGLVSAQMKASNLRAQASRMSFSVAMTAPGSFMLLIDLGLVAADPQQLLELRIAQNPMILAGMQVMFLASGVVLLAIGLLIPVTGTLVARRTMAPHFGRYGSKYPAQSGAYVLRAPMPVAVQEETFWRGRGWRNLRRPSMVSDKP